MDNLDEMNNFLDRYQIPKLNQDQVNYISKLIMPNEIEALIKSLPTTTTTTKTQDQMGSVQNSVRTSKETQYQYSSHYSTK